MGSDRLTAGESPPWLRAARIAVAERRWFGSDRDDALQIASVAAWQASQRFDTERGVPEVAFCLRRARGALLDELRHRSGIRHDHRTVRSRYQTVSLEGLGEAADWVPFGEEDHYPSDIDTAGVDEQLCWADTPVEEEIMRCFAAGHTGEAIAKALGVSGSRISQIRKRIADRRAAVRPSVTAHA